MPRVVRDYVARRRAAARDARWRMFGTKLSMDYAASKHFSRQVAMLGLGRVARRAIPRGGARALCAGVQLKSQPGATLRIRGGGFAALEVRSNMETDIVEVGAMGGGALAAEAVECTTDGQGDVMIGAKAGADSESPPVSVAVGVPAVFNVDLDVSGRCDIEVGGWIEGSVDVAVRSAPRAPSRTCGRTPQSFPGGRG